MKMSEGIVVCCKKNMLERSLKKRLNGSNDPKINGWRGIVTLSSSMVLVLLVLGGVPTVLQLFFLKINCGGTDWI